MIATAILTVAVVAVTATSAGAANGPGQDAHFFTMTAKSTGSYAADYGEDRFEEGLITAFGVDGVESGSWSWKMRAVGRAVGNGQLHSSAAEFIGSGRHSAEIISWGVQNGELGETRLCQDENGDPSEPTRTFTGYPPHLNQDPGKLWVHTSDVKIQQRIAGFALAFPSEYELLGHCYHSVPPVNFSRTYVMPYDAPVPNGAFNPRSDRSYSESWSDSVNVPRDDHGLVEQEHTEVASSELSIEVRSVSERKATKLRDRYRETPKGDLYGTH